MEKIDIDYYCTRIYYTKNSFISLTFLIMRVIPICLLLLLVIPFSNAYFDLTIEWVKVSKEIAYEGEILEIKARVKNLGSNHPFTISFYLDELNESRLIGSKYYDSIEHYRIPSIEWDTKGILGKHKIIAYLEDVYGKEIAYCNITLLPSEMKKILIAEVYYNCYPNRNNEFICIQNFDIKEVNLEGWYLTTQPWKRANKQNKIIFPNIVIKPNEKIYVTQNATSFKKEMDFEADFEYYNCSSAPDLERIGSFILSNDGSVVCLKDKYNHTIDVVVYGNAYFYEGWIGKPIDKVSKGVILKRKDAIDTNTSKDWEWNRTFVIGQSDFEVFYGKANKAIAFCSPDCSYKTISNEIKNASSLLINLYLFTNPFLAKLLNESNASIKILLDGNVYGGIPMEERYIAYMLSNKAEIRYLMGNEEEGIYKRYRYDHAKYVVIDNNKCIIHSANWAKSGIPADNSYGNREWGIVIENESLANFLEKVFYYDWNPNFQDSVEFNESSFTHGKPPEDFSISFYIPKGKYKPKFSPLYVNSSFNISIILAPDNAEEEIIKLIEEANEEILVEQAYIQKDWSNGLNPFLRKIIEENKTGVKVYVILNNYEYGWSSAINKETKNFLEKNGIKVKMKKSITIHNKGIIVDGKKVLISSINWGENSVRRNREIGIIVEEPLIAQYFEEIFWYDWDYKEEKKGGIEIIYAFIAFLLIIILRRKIK